MYHCVLRLGVSDWPASQRKCARPRKTPCLIHLRVCGHVQASVVFAAVLQVVTKTYTFHSPQCAVNVIWNAMLCLLWRGLARAHKTTTTTNHEDGLAARMEATGLLGSQTLWLVTPTGAALARAA